MNKTKNETDVLQKALALLPTLATLPVVLLLFSCSSHCHYRDESDSALRSIPVPESWTTYVEELPSELLARDNGEVIRRQNFTIESDGLFTFNRSVEVEVGFFGASLRELDPKHAERLGLQPFEGVRVRSVERDGPAGRAGLSPDDVILAFGDEKPGSVDHLKHLISLAKPGETVALEVARAGNTLAMRVEIGDETLIRDGAGFQRQLEILDDRPRTGLKLVELTEEVKPLVLGPDRSTESVLIRKILPGGPAYDSNLRAGDLLVRVGDRPVAHLVDYQEAVADFNVGDRVTVVARRKRQLIEASLKIEEDATTDTSLNLLIVEYGRKPERTKFSVLGGILFTYRGCRSINKRGELLEHERSRGWGCLLNLIKYKSDPNLTEFRLGWIFPLTFRRN